MAVASILFANCKTKSKATTSSAPNKTVADDGTKVQCRVAVSFISFASGIDAPVYDKIEAYIKAHPKKPAFEVIPMGREGERDICMSLKEMNKAEMHTVAAFKLICTAPDINAAMRLVEFLLSDLLHDCSTEFTRGIATPVSDAATRSAVRGQLRAGLE